MKLVFLCAAILAFSHMASATEKGMPICKAELNDEVNTPVNRFEWQEKVFMGSVNTPTQTILISSSAGDNKIMSLWVREKKDKPNGMFSFVDLSSGRDQYLRFYVSDEYSLGITCRWDSEK